ncbi:glycosyltransferase family 4 protein [Adhaeretor mobilis]
MRALVDTGSKVTVMTADASPEVEQRIRALGVEFRPYSIQRNAMSISSDRQTLTELRTALAELKPTTILAYTIKPIIWGGIAWRSSAARRCNETRFFALVTGLGYAFQGGSLKRRVLSTIVTKLYRTALRHATAVIFQNADNRDLFVERRIVDAAKCHVVSGSGINVAEFAQSPLSKKPPVLKIDGPAGPPHFLLIARLLGEKGIREYCRAAEQVKAKVPEARFSLVGPEDPSPDGISLEEIKRWHDAGTIHYHGATTDVRPFLQDCHIYTLPSYHEGMPRTVLEAMATGRPILTTEVPGCKETVQQGVNGWLVPKADADALAERMLWFIENRDQWQTMADASRKLAEEKFDVRIVNQQMLAIMGLE